MHSEEDSTYSLSIECKDIILREYLLEDLDKIHELTWRPGIYEFLPGRNVEKEVRLDWLKNYEIPENNQFLRRVEEGVRVEDLRLKLGIVLKETGKFIKKFLANPTFGVHEYKYIILTNSNLKRGV
ncbi:hypothetical protein [Paenibacillus polymyxa]|uniref:hypothetical protein n=1 Tax=Paenibacillus polymyxa TaxID=1406 RepID=UPI0001E6CCD2|nr:hypothetical protein [Paenibacillus polymyxa]WPQ55448.1 hypothetical protein SKN87_17840 [Paenibacillus polymyxa]